MLQEASQPIKVRLFFQQNIIRVALRLLLESRLEFHVSGDEEPLGNNEVLLLDMDSKESVKQAMQSHNSKILALASAALPDSFTRAIEVGAKGLVLKEQGVETLFKAIKQVHAGEICFDKQSLLSLLEKYNPSGDADEVKLSQLTRREVDVARLVGSGLRNRQIAERLFISERTVRSHLESIFQKLQVKDRVELAIWSVKIKLNKAQMANQP